MCATLACTLPGCGGATADGKTTDRIKASGKVELEGKPIPAGTVTFLHNDTGNIAVCPIDDGTYESESDQGPNPGLNAVIIDAKETEDGDPMWANSWRKQNVQVADGAEFTEDFKITGGEVKPFDPSKVQIDN